jgi:hypothetical protein
VKGDVRIVLDIEEILAFQLAVLHAAPRIHGGSINLDVQNAGRKLRRSKGQSRVPLVELADDSDGSLDVKLHGALCVRDLENRNLRPTCRR